MKNPKVSILCLTYNHEKYIKQALDSFLMQKTNFDFEVLIHDDASTDKTPQIIKQYQKKYPQIIKPIFSKYNKYSKGIRDLVIKYLLPKAKGKYIALCEGDDYWTNENKLQLQADFLDKNPDYTICFHKTLWFWENGEEKNRICPDYFKIKKYDLENLLKGSYMSTSSIFVRKINYKYISKKNIAMGDWYFSLYHAKFGKIGFIPKVMSARRKHNRGIWWDFLVDPIRLVKNNGLHMLNMHEEVFNLFADNEKYKKIIISNIEHLLNQIIEADKRFKTKIFDKVLINHSKLIYKIAPYINSINLYEKLNKLNQNNLKILFFSHTAELGGSERSLLELIDKLLEKDVLITVILPYNGPLKKFLDEKGVITEIISYNWWAKIEKISPQEIIEKNTETLKNLLSAIPRLKELNPDVIYTNTVVIPWGAITAIILNKPHIWHLREFGKIDHGLHFDLEEKEVKKFINTTSNAVITNSKALYDFYKDEVDEKKMSVAYNYIQISKKLLEEKPKINPFKNKDTLKLLILAAITPSKGQLDAVLAIHEIIKKNYKVELAIVGQKNNKLYLEQIEKYIKDNNLESFIHIFDFIDNPYPVIKLADIVLNCSVNEAFGRTTVEAMLLKKPVIGTKRGGTLELIKEGVNGFHYESGNYKELAKKIEFFILNKNKIKELAENGYEFVKENITKKKSWGKIYKIIKKVATENPCFNNYQIFIQPIVNILKENISSFIYQSQLQQQQSQIQNLETQLNTIKSAKFFRLWQSYCKIRDKILRRKI
jgi:glycosyltransferase involved in cell wall biosynthesis